MAIVINILFKKPYLKEFLISYYGNTYPVKASLKNEIGKYIKPLLSSPPDVPHHIKLKNEGEELRKQLKHHEPDDKGQDKYKLRIDEIRKELDYIKNGCYISIQLPQIHGIREDSMNYISPDNQKLFEGLCQDLFEAIFFSFVDARIGSGFTQADCLRQFSYKYDIPLNDMNFEMLKKKYDRHKKEEKKCRKNQQKNVEKLSRQLSRRLTSLIILC